MENTKSSLGINDSITIRQASLEDEAVVQAIFDRSPNYFRKVDGCEVEPHFARREMNEHPKKLGPFYKKCFLIVERNNEPIGVVDLYGNHPDPGITYLGLLLLVEGVHGRGVGRKAYEAAEILARKELNSTVIRIGVSEKNNVEKFWSKMGFIRNGFTYIWKGEKESSQVFEMEKSI